MEQEINGISRTKEEVVQNLDCHYCISALNDAEYFYYEPLENIITWFPEKQLIHIHFGKPTWNDAITLEEAEWLRDSCLAAFKKGGRPLFAVADFSRTDDSEFPTREAIRIYGETTAHEMTAHVVCFGVSISMQMILKLISSVSKGAKKITFEPTLEKCMKEHEEWLLLNQSA
jgi:hypothetical protein